MSAIQGSGLDGTTVFHVKDLRGNASILSNPEDEVVLREPRAYSHHSGVIGNNDKVIDGEYEWEGGVIGYGPV